MKAKKCPRCNQEGGIREDGYHVPCFLMDENDRLRAVVEKVAEGCGHDRCHVRPWITAARKALR